MDTSPQNNVTVEYTDPSGLFPLVRPIIETKLPLRNLHWNSPSRPIRSIESLRIGFVPAKHHDGSAERKPSSDATAGAVAHRRHQIPGLRQTPYLKIYLLRCDDNDTYKASARKALREWIKTHASTPQSGSSTATSSPEKHDAFEWLILHVVQDGAGQERASVASKWPGLSTTTVLEKVKADFNSSSKSSVDRVAQLRLPKPPGTTTAAAAATQKPSPELADQLEDLVEKMKNGILASFDLRVAQYEEDIKEKDSQRSLPGWNFCTFFILKEGLARGFENVGLFEDALVGYDELAVGLDAAIREQLLETGDQHAGALLTYSKDWKEKAQKALESTATAGNAGDNNNNNNTSKDEEGEEEGRAGGLLAEINPEDFPLNSNKKPYRDMILANDISVFDFRTYLFSRQLTLLLRAARAPSLAPKETKESQKSQRKDRKKPEDLMLLSEICERATEFISIAARTLRYDLEYGLEGVEGNVAKTEVINNLVSSWSYAAASQILSQTFTPILAIPESPLHAAVAEARPDVPRRSSSLLSPPSAAPRPRPTSQEIMSSDFHNPIHKAWSNVTQKTGSEQLASGRGQLFFLARRFLEEIAGRSGWTEKWHDLGLLFDDSKDAGQNDLKEVSLEDDNEDHQKVVQSVLESKSISPLSCIDIPVLTTAFKSKKAYLSLYEELTDQMFRHYITANRTYSAEMAIADIAILRFRQADYAAAATYFHQIAPFYGNKYWVILEGAMLEMYARCLKELKRNEEHVRMTLRLLAKFAAHTQANMSSRQKSLGLSSVFTEETPVSTYVEELFEASSALPKEVSASLSDFFADLHVDPAILLYEGKDGFQIQLSLRFLLGRQISIDSVKIRLVSASNLQNNEHWVENSGKFVVKSSSTKLLVDSSMTLQGKYFVDRIEMRVGNIIFSMGGGNHSALALGFKEGLDSDEEDSRPYIHCYAAPDGLQAKIVSPHLINLEEMRTLEVEFDSGRNNIKSGTIRVRPGTAGLRLRVSEAKVVNGEININVNESGNIELTEFGPKSFARFRIPYTVDENHTMLSARVEVTYETDQGRFSYSSVYNIVSALPISVNVQDIFKDDALFSRFTVSPAMMIPLRILNCSIPSSEVYEVQSSILESVALDVFPKQPASLLYKIKQRGQSGAPGSGSKGSLRLTVEFTCVDDECLDALQKKFRTDIESSKFQQYTSLLSSHIVEAFRTQLSPTDMEVIGLLREIEVLSYENLGWDSILRALKGPKDEIRDWLMEWHKTNRTIPLPDQPSILKRRLIIPLDVPDVQVVHTAELRLQNLPSQPAHAAVGQMIAAELRLRHTRRWCSQDNQENVALGSPLEFSYEIYANPDSWLVGGRKRGHYTAVEGETKTFSVMLLPQKPGYLLLPGLEIKTFVPSPSPSLLTGIANANPNPNTNPSTPSGGGGPELQRRQIPCEVDYRNHGETLLVLPDLRKTTVSLSPSGGHPGGGSWLVDSERRSKSQSQSQSQVV